MMMMMIIIVKNIDFIYSDANTGHYPLKLVATIKNTRRFPIGLSIRFSFPKPMIMFNAKSFHTIKNAYLQSVFNNSDRA